MHKEGGLNFGKILNEAIDFLYLIRKIKTIFIMFFIFLIAIFGVTHLTFCTENVSVFYVGLIFGPKNFYQLKKCL